MLSNPDAALIALYAGLAAGFIVLAIVLVRNGTARYIWQVLRKQPQDLTPDVIKQYRSDAEALRKAAYLPELLSVALTLAWAWHARDGWLFSLIFCAGFIGFVWLKARSVPAATRAFIGERWALASVLSLVSIGSLAMLLITSVFDATNTSDDEAQRRLEASNPAKALDEQISIARERLANLGAFADAERAHADEQKAEQVNQQAQQHRAQVQTQLAQLTPPTLPSDMAKYMASDCSPKRDSRGSPFTTRAAELCPSWQAMTADYQRQRAALESQLGIVTTSNSASYAEKHAEYLGQQQHLESLLKQRSELSETGQGIKQAWRAEDRIIGEWLGVSPATANSIKWLLFAIAFDVISLLARVASALLLNQAGGDPQSEARRRFNAMVNSGIDANIAASLLTPPTHRPAGFTANYEEPTRKHPAGFTAAPYSQYTTQSPTQPPTHLGYAYTTHVSYALPTHTPQPTTQAKRKGEQATCPVCSNQFTRRTNWHKYCCEDCRIKGNGFTDKTEMLAKRRAAKA